MEVLAELTAGEEVAVVWEVIVARGGGPGRKMEVAVVLGCEGGNGWVKLSGRWRELWFGR